MQPLILSVHILVCLMLVGLILIQHGKGADAGAAFGGGGGASGSVFGSQGSASFLSRASAILATVFFITSLTLAYFSNEAPSRSQSVTDIVPAVEEVVEETPADLPDLP